MFSTLANKLTLSRIIIIPVIVLFLIIDQVWASWVSLGLFALAGFTDWLDGFVARREGTVTRIGQFLDPIADKLLVAAILLILVFTGKIDGLNIFPAVVILLREVAVSGLREFLAQVQVSVPVSQMAKWKTFIQILALGFLIMGHHAPWPITVYSLGTLTLWAAGILTVITAYDYWRAGLKHMLQK